MGTIEAWNLTWRKAAPLAVLRDPVSARDVEDYLEVDPRSPTSNKVARFALHTDGTLFIVNARNLCHGDDVRANPADSARLLFGTIHIRRPLAEWQITDVYSLLKGLETDWMGCHARLLSQIRVWRVLTQEVEDVWYGACKPDESEAKRLRRMARLEDYSDQEISEEMARRRPQSMRQ